MSWDFEQSIDERNLNLKTVQLPDGTLWCR